MTQPEQKENAIMKTLLFATAAVTALCVAAPASARVHHHYYGAYGAYDAYGAYRAYRPRRSPDDYYYVPYNPSGAYGFRGYLPDHYATYCGQMPKAC
jgi:hypothetical protein